MPTLSDIFGAGYKYDNATPEQIKRLQEHAYALLKPRTEANRSWASPIADILHALRGQAMINKSTEAQANQRQEGAQTGSDLLTQIQRLRAQQQDRETPTGSAPASGASLPDTVALPPTSGIQEPIPPDASLPTQKLPEPEPPPNFGVPKAG